MKKANKIFVMIVVAVGALVFVGAPDTQAAANLDGSVNINEYNFPDEAFRNYISEEVDKNKDQVLQEKEIESVTCMEVGFEWDSITGEYWRRTSKYSVKGIEYFQNLEELHINEFFELTGKIPDLPVLTFIQVRERCVSDARTEKITTEKLFEKLPMRKIDSLHIIEGDIGRLDLTSAKKLKKVAFGDNLIDYDAQPYMTAEKIVLKNNKYLENVSFENVDLKQLELPSSSPIEHLNFDATTVKKLNVSKYRNLKTLLLWDTAIKSLDLSKNRQLKYVSVKKTNVEKLELPPSGLIEHLDIENLPNKKLDVSRYKNLKILSLENTRIKHLDLRQNRKLERLNIRGSKVKIILPKKAKLKEIELALLNKVFDLSNCTSDLEKIGIYYVGGKIKMNRNIFKTLWKKQQLKIFVPDSNSKYRGMVQKKKVKIPQKGKYIYIQV